MILPGGHPGHFAVGDHTGGHGFEKQFSERHDTDAVEITLMGVQRWCMTCSPSSWGKDGLKGAVDLVAQTCVGGIEANQACKSFRCIRSVRGGDQPVVHRTNHSFWDLSLTALVPRQALIQRRLQPPADPLHLPRPKVSVHQPLPPVELPMGRIHKHVHATSKGAVDSPVEQRLQLRPGALNARIPPQLQPQIVAGDNSCSEQWSEGCSE